MPKIRPGMKKPPADFAHIADDLDAFETQLKDALCETNPNGKSSRKNEVTWNVSKINRDRARCVWNAWRDRKISEACLKYCCDMNFVDAGLIKCWKLSGYEHLCCTACVKGGAKGSSSVCVCRVPGKKLSAPCASCGCTGCASGTTSEKVTTPSSQPKELPLSTDVQ